MDYFKQLAYSTSGEIKVAFGNSQRVAVLDLEHVAYHVTYRVSVHIDTVRVAGNSLQRFSWGHKYNHSLSLDATVMVSNTCPIIGEDVVIIFLTK